MRKLRVAGMPADVTPFVPAAYRPYFDSDGGGGVRVTLATKPDPICEARVDTPAERRKVYRDAAARRAGWRIRHSRAPGHTR